MLSARWGLFTSQIKVDDKEREEEEEGGIDKEEVEEEEKEEKEEGGCWGSELQLCIGRSNERGWSFSISLTTSTEKQRVSSTHIQLRHTHTHTHTNTHTHTLRGWRNHVRTWDGPGAEMHTHTHTHLPGQWGGSRMKAVSESGDIREGQTEGRLMRDRRTEVCDWAAVFPPVREVWSAALMAGPTPQEPMKVTFTALSCAPFTLHSINMWYYSHFVVVGFQCMLALSFSCRLPSHHSFIDSFGSSFKCIPCFLQWSTWQHRCVWNKHRKGRLMISNARWFHYPLIERLFLWMIDLSLWNVRKTSVTIPPGCKAMSLNCLFSPKNIVKFKDIESTSL